MTRRQVEPEDEVEDMLREHPRAVVFLREQGVVCLACGEPVWGTLGALLEDKGLDVDQVLAELNAFLTEESGGSS